MVRSELISNYDSIKDAGLIGDSMMNGDQKTSEANSLTPVGSTPNCPGLKPQLIPDSLRKQNLFLNHYDR